MVVIQFDNRLAVELVAECLIHGVRPPLSSLPPDSMADPVASVERIVKVGLKIKEAVDTARRNEVVCQEIGRRVLRFSAILSQLQRAGAMDEGSPATSGALGDLEETLQRALELVAACQERRGAVHRLLAARDLARQLREVKDDILNKVMLASFAINAHTTILMLTMHTGGYLLPRLLHQEDTQVVEVSQSSHSTDSTAISQSSHSTDSTAIANLREFMPSKLWAATINYSDGNIIGRGGSCTVYKGILEDGNAVAVKIFHGPNLGRKHTYDQLVLASKLQHKNIAKVLGYAEGRIGIEEQEYIWIEEYMPKGTLRNFIYEQVLDYAGPRQLDYWLALMRTINGIAQGVHYLHGQHVVHLDLKPDNILFDSYMNPVITDFELSKVLDETEITSEHNKIAGTFPYIAPEHTADGIISTKSDVYAFGITLLEAIGGLRRRSEFPLHRWGWAAWEAGLIEEEFDPAVFIKGSHQLEKIKRYIEVGLLCAQQDRADRPTMADVLEMLEGEKKLPTPKKPAYADPYDKSWIPVPGGFTSISANALHLSCQERALLRSSVWSEGSLSPSSWSEGSLSPR